MLMWAASNRTTPNKRRGINECKKVNANLLQLYRCTVKIPSALATRDVVSRARWTLEKGKVRIAEDSYLDISRATESYRMKVKRTNPLFIASAKES